MGQDKRRLALGPRTVLETTVRCLALGGVDPVVVVLEPQSPCQGLPGLAQALLTENPDPSRGMLSSIRQGLQVVPAAAKAVAVLPGDHPFVPPQVVKTLLTAFAEKHPPLLAPRYLAENRRGHPLLIRRDLFAEAMACDDQVGLRQLVHRHSQDILEVPLETVGAEDDLDRPEDLWRLERLPKAD